MVPSSVEGGNPYYFVATCDVVASASTSSSGGFLSMTMILALSAAVLVVLLIVLLLLLRYRRQRKQLKAARMMVLAHNGDVAFGTPEPMRKEPAKSLFAGGEIDPETGEMTLYKTSTKTTIEGKNLADYSDARLPSVWGGKRSNPLLMGLNNFGLDEEAQDNSQSEESEESMSLSDDDSLMDELDDLSDFETFDERYRSGAAANGAYGSISSRKAKGSHRNPPQFKKGSYRNPPPFMGASGAESLSDNDSDDSEFDDPEFVFNDGGRQAYLDVASDTESDSESDAEEVVVSWGSATAKRAVPGQGTLVPPPAAFAPAPPPQTPSAAPRSILKIRSPDTLDQDGPDGLPDSPSSRKVTFPSFDEPNFVPPPPAQFGGHEDDTKSGYDDVSLDEEEEEDNSFGALRLQRDNSRYSNAREARRMAADIEQEVVVAEPSYADLSMVTKEWETVELPEDLPEPSSSESEPEMEDDKEKVGSHFHAVKAVWGKRTNSKTQ